MVVLKSLNTGNAPVRPFDFKLGSDHSFPMYQVSSAQNINCRPLITLKLCRQRQPKPESRPASRIVGRTDVAAMQLDHLVANG